MNLMGQKVKVPFVLLCQMNIAASPKEDENCPYKMECEVVNPWQNGNTSCWMYILRPTSIRKGYKGDTTHSILVDQWDFEIRINKEQRTVEQLKSLFIH